MGQIVLYLNVSKKEEEQKHVYWTHWWSRQKTEPSTGKMSKKENNWTIICTCLWRAKNSTENSP
jgi:hypothetical protein